MAIYRPPKARWPLALAAGIGGLLLGLLLGLALKSGDPDPTEAAQNVKAELLSAAGSLEVAAIEYDEAVEEGEVVREAEYRGALDAVTSARSRYADVRPALAQLSPALAAGIDTAFDNAEQMMQDSAGEEEVASALRNLERLLKGDVPGT